MLFSFVAEGRIASQPRFDTTDKGTSFLTFRFLHSDRYRDHATGEWRDRRPVGLDVTAWGRLADNCQRLRKGDLITISFRPDLRVRDDNGLAVMHASAESISVSAAFDQAHSFRRPKTADPATGNAIRTPDGELITA